jgi:hypothetical protein
MDDAATRAALIGTWQLVHCTRRLTDTGETVYPYGEAPAGFLSYGADGRMMVLLLNGKRPRPADVLPTDAECVALFRSMGAYAGRYSVAGGSVIHDIDGSWNESLTGTRQVRHFRLDGERLILTTDAYRSVYDGREGTYELIWQRLAQGGA